MTEVDLLHHLGALDKQNLKEKIRMLQVKVKKPKQLSEDYDISTIENI